MRRTQRSSQRSADSKLTSGSGVYQPASDSGVASVAESDRVPGVTSERIPGALEDNGGTERPRTGGKKSTTLMLDVRPPETGNGVQYLETPKNGVGAVTSSEDTDREGKVSARDRLVRDK